ncbi:nitroreductase family protein [Nocardioides plantarum]|uniref:Nitroreductase family protein n=1 Tax=Nocardioides plantarum TaxID=29299 RepID=A0ABV5K739_9ACTN|nr:nitroreductase family protein [Nocardioides plantarum]
MSTALESTALVTGRADAGPILQDRWWWRTALGDVAPDTPAWAVPQDGAPVEDDLGRDLAGGTPAGPGRPWPTGATARLAERPYAGGVGGGGDAGPLDAWGHVVVTTFGPVRRDPDNPYNDHRAYPSARCLFPVRAVERAGGRLGLLHPESRTTLDLGPVARGPVDAPSLTLSGRYTAIPESYGWMRGSLVGLELGIVLRQLAVAATLHGVPLRVTPPGDADPLADVDLDDPGSWSPAWTVTAGAVPAPAPLAPAVRRPPPRTDDPCLRDLAAALAEHPVTGPTVPLPAGVPDDLVPPASATTWAETMWRRGSGRMPRGLHGFSLLPRRVPAAAVRDAVAWLRHPPPAGLLADVHAATTARVVLQDVDGLADGLHRLTAGGDLERSGGHQDGAHLAAAVEAVYGYPRSPGVGCGIGSATALWFLTVRPRDLVRRHGPAAWTAAQVSAGWITQGLCLAAAAHGLVARPMRAFPEAGVADVLGLDPDEMVSIAVCVGTDPPTGGLQLDLRH